jgi:hypothetical protein
LPIAANFAELGTTDDLLDHPADMAALSLDKVVDQRLIG